MLCLGTDLKNTFCLVRGEQAVFVSIWAISGTMASRCGGAKRSRLMQNIYDFTPQYVVHDAHAGYVSSQWAREMNLPTQTVLHHHAHAAACLAEHQWPLDGGDVVALTLDGIGMGSTALCGRRVPAGELRECQHLGGLPAVALPGGDLAAKQPWRNLLAQCLRFVPEWQNYSETASVATAKLERAGAGH
ncbi:hypothetical protein ACLK1T_19645 [Escherichia coli]